MSLVNNLDNIFKKGVIGNVRKAQEDSHDMALKTPNGDLFVVCDGMGGHVGGAKASSLAVESIISYMKGQYYPNPIDALNGSLQFANMQILGFADAHPEYKGMGTTACIVLMRDNDVWIAHAGDSRIYLYLGKERQLHRITRDHSLVQTLVDSGQITDDEAEHHPNKNRILKALGIKPELKPTFNHLNQPIHPKNGDIFLICTDGLCGMISDNTIERVLGDNSSLANKGEVLISLAMQGEIVQPGGQDNCTLELIQIDGSPFKTSYFHSENPVGRPQGGQSGKSSRKKTTIILAAVAAVVLATIIGLTALFIINAKNEEKLRAELKEHKQEVKDWEDSIKRCDEYIKKFNKDKETLESQIKQLEQGKKLQTLEGKPITIDSTKSKLEQIETNITYTNKNKDDVQNTINNLNKKIDKIEKELNKKNGNRDTGKAGKGKHYTKKTPKAENPPSPVIASGTPTKDDASLSEEEKLNKEFNTLYNQLKTDEKWQLNVYLSPLFSKGTKKNMNTLKNLWEQNTIDKKKDMISEIKKAKPKK